MVRVLVVDDEPDLVQLISRQLRARGHNAVGVTTPEEALRLVEERGAPDVAVLDVTMPGRSGFELLADLRCVPGCEQLPAVFLSARVRPEDIEAGRALGARYLTKPYVASALLAAIDAAQPVPAAEGW